MLGSYSAVTRIIEYQQRRQGRSWTVCCSVQRQDQKWLIETRDRARLTSATKGHNDRRDYEGNRIGLCATSGDLSGVRVTRPLPLFPHMTSAQPLSAVTTTSISAPPPRSATPTVARAGRSSPKNSIQAASISFFLERSVTKIEALKK